MKRIKLPHLEWNTEEEIDQKYDEILNDDSLIYRSSEPNDQGGKTHIILDPRRNGIIFIYTNSRDEIIKIKEV